MSNKLLTIVLTIDYLPNYFDITLNSLVNQTNNNFDLYIIDKNHLTNFEDVKYESSENMVIYKCETPLIYFMTESDILRLNFVSYIYQYYFENVDYFIINKLDNYKINNASDKIYNVEFLRHNYISFDMSEYRYNIDHIKFNYITENVSNNFYHIKRKLCYSNKYLITDFKSYYTSYTKMIEELRTIYLSTNMNEKLKNSIIYEKNYIDREHESNRL